VIDNTTTAVQPALPFGTASAAVVNYAIQIGDMP
jgi:hypothetical protein